MKKEIRPYLLSTFILIFVSNFVYSHCEVPCGIYDDQARVTSIQEHSRTVEKSMKKIVELSGEGKINYNQLIRWTKNKEVHAKKIQDIANQYFLTQRLKPTKPTSIKYVKYVSQLQHLHQIIVHAMKCKQTTDITHVEKIRTHLRDFSASYFGKPEGSHPHEGSHKH
jgi:nickel superoxide dismutase